MKIHPAAELFPVMGDSAFKSFKESIKLQGQLEPVKVFNGLLLDGRNREKACEELGIALLFENVETDDPIQYVIAANIERRQLTTKQKAAIAAELANMVPGNVKAQKDSGTQNCAPKISIEQAADMMGVSPRSVTTAKKVMNDDPKAHADAKAGIKAKHAPKKKAAHKKAKYSWVTVAVQEGVLSPSVAGSERSACKKEIEAVDSDPDLFKATHEDQLRRACIFLRIQSDPDLTEAAKEQAMIACESLTEKEEKQVAKAIRLARRQIEVEIQTRVTEQLQTILPVYKAKGDAADKIKRAYKGILTATQFKKLLSFLHSDRHQDDLMKRKADELFKLVKENEDLLCKPKESEPIETLPGNVADLMAMRRKKA